MLVHLLKTPMHGGVPYVYPETVAYPPCSSRKGRRLLQLGLLCEKLLRHWLSDLAGMEWRSCWQGRQPTARSHRHPQRSRVIIAGPVAHIDPPIFPSHRNHANLCVGPRPNDKLGPPSGNNLRAALRGEVVNEVVSEVVVCKAVGEVVRWNNEVVW